MQQITNLKKLIKSVRLFLTSQADLDRRLTEAVQQNDIEKAKSAIADGAVCERWGNDETHPIALAISQNNIDMLRLLFEKAQASPDQSLGYYQGTPLRHAIAKDNMTAFDLLIEKGADINLKQSGQEPLLFFAIQNGKDHFIRRLLDLGAKFDCPNSSGWTALFYATQKGDAKLVQELLNKGARTYLRDSKGKSVLDVAVQFEKFAVYDLIQKHIDQQVPEWQAEDADCVVHRKILRSAGYSLTQVFNFKTSQHTHITHRFATGRDETVTKSFDQLAQPELIEMARAKIQGVKL
jgi:hypothetical protein